MGAGSRRADRGRAKGDCRRDMARTKSAAHPERSERSLRNDCGTLSLEHLEGLPVTEARAWLETLPGVGPKTSAAVLSFSELRGIALPVDSHHHRVAQRLGLIAANVDVGPSHADFRIVPAAGMGRAAGLRPSRGFHAARSADLLS